MSGSVLAAIERALVERFGQQPQRAALSFVGVDPIEVLRFVPRPDERVYVTLGMARHPMSDACGADQGYGGGPPMREGGTSRASVGAPMGDARGADQGYGGGPPVREGGTSRASADCRETAAVAPIGDVAGPRAELLLRLRDPTDVMSEVWKALGLLAATPAVEGFVYRDGASVDLGRPLVSGSRCVGVLAVVTPELPAVVTEEGPVALLEALPVTSAELAWCRVRGSGALRDRWAAEGTDLLDLTRGSVRLV